MKRIILIPYLLVLSIFISINAFATGVIVDKPDYIISEMTFTPENQIEGGKITFTAVVVNAGIGQTLRTSTLNWSICEQACALESNWTVKETDSVSGLKVGSQEIETFTLIMPYGDIQIKVTCDVTNVISETNETNNTQETTITIEQPDLKVRSEGETQIWWEPARPVVGQEVLFYALIENVGKGGSTEDFEVEFFIDDVSLGKTKVSEDIQFPVFDNDTLVQSYQLSAVGVRKAWVATPGTGEQIHKIKVSVDVGKKVDETNEDNNIQEKLMTPIDYPDMVVTDIWWKPEDPSDGAMPADGENVKFYAQIDNVGLGGTSSDFKVSFIIDRDTTNEVDLGEIEIKNDVIPGKRKPLINRLIGGFEQEYLDQWWKMEVGRISIENHCADDDAMCKEQNDNQYYLRLDGYNTVVRSTAFTPEGSILEFRSQITGSGNKWFRLCRKDTDCTNTNLLKEIQIKGTKSVWSSYVVDILDITDPQIQIELRTEKSSNATFMIDDIRMGDTDTSDGKVTIAVAVSDSWEARTGIHTITAIIDPENTISESPTENADNQEKTVEIVYPSGDGIPKADYNVVSIIRTPIIQIQEQEFTYSAVVINNGADTLVEANLNWYVKTDNDIDFPVKPEETDVISGLKNGESVEHSFKLAAQNGITEIKVIVNDDGALTESDWVEWNNAPGPQNAKYDTIELWPADLEVKKIWWSPEQPIEGEDVVFYAEIDNIGDGGTAADFDVQFILDKGKSTETDLGTITVKDDALLSRRLLAVTNGDFEGNCNGELDPDNKLCGWYVVTGGVSIESHCQSKCLASDTECLDVCLKNTKSSVTFPVTNQYYARLYGYNTLFRSGNFLLEGDILEFKAQSSGSGQKNVFIREILSPTYIPSINDPILITKSITGKTGWTGFVLDITNFQGKRVYVELQTYGSANAVLMVDDFRLTGGTDPVMVAIVASNKWQALTGVPEITVYADYNLGTEIVVPEFDKSNNELSVPMSEGIGKSDYAIDLLINSTPEQIQGRDVELYAVVKNESRFGTDVKSDVIWWTCRPDEVGSCHVTNWKDVWSSDKKITIPGLGAYETYTVTYSFEALYGNTEVRVEANADESVSEELSNIVNYATLDTNVEVQYSDLAVKNIWWVPENPIDGEEVTFYAQIDNQDSGGTTDDYEVTFIVKNNSDGTEEDLGTAKIKDETMFAGRKSLFDAGPFASGDNENDKLTPDWDLISGSVSVTSRCEGSLWCSKSIENEYYVYLSGLNGLLRSRPFYLDGDLLEFIGYTIGSGKKYLIIREMLANDPAPATDPILIKKEYVEKSPWRANLINIPPAYNGKMVYIEILTEGSSNAGFILDDFRMFHVPGQYVLATIATPKKTWIAAPGNYSITVSVDTKEDIKESNEDNQSLSRTILYSPDMSGDGQEVGKADYEMIKLIYEPSENVYGETILFTAVFKNIGSPTLVRSDIQWLVQEETEADWKSVQKTTIDGLSTGEYYTTTYQLTVKYDKTSIAVICDAGTIAGGVNTDNGNIIESNESNNRIEESIFIQRPDLTVEDIWWVPQTPKDGEEVTFYARIDNTGNGGTNEDYEVRFSVKKGEGTDTAEDIGKEKIKDDIPFANQKSAFTNSGFEGEGSTGNKNKLNGWTILSGSVFVESRCSQEDTQCRDTIGNEFYARLTGANTTIKSPVFSMLQHSILSFRGFTSGSGQKIIRIREANPALGNPIRLEKDIAGKSQWFAYNIDISKITNISAYIELVTTGSSNAVFMVDDFRMGQSDEPILATIVSTSKKWTAKTGDVPYFVTAELVMKNVETNPTRTEQITSVGKADYRVMSLTFSPQEQVEGGVVDFVAVIKNADNASDTQKESNLTWYTCRPDEKDCGNKTDWQAAWSRATVEKVEGLSTSESQSFTLNLTMTGYGETLVRVFADSDDSIIEIDESSGSNQADASFKINRPDLVVGNIWWSPPFPADGEEVQFYAAIENLGDGGTTESFDVVFTIDPDADKPEELGSVSSRDEIQMAVRKQIEWNTIQNFDAQENYIGNAGFELGDLSYWAYKGSVFIENRDDGGTYGGGYAIIDKYYARLYGENTVMYSPAFTLFGDSLIFKGYTAGSGNKYLYIRKQNYVNNQPMPPSQSDTILVSKQYTDKAPWHAILVDISKYSTQNAYIELRTEGAKNAEFFVDDFRMAKESGKKEFVTIVAAKSLWTASPGNHILKVSVDDKQKISEINEDNNESRTPVFSPEKVYYTISMLPYSPREQLIGRDIKFQAIIQNQSSNNTFIESDIEWFVCQGEKTYCDRDNKWVSKESETIAGLSSNEVYTAVYDMTVEYNKTGPGDSESFVLSVKAISHQGDGTLANPEVYTYVTIYHPDLRIYHSTNPAERSVWWVPENPVDGEEVTFYARIDNEGKGGTTQDFDVSFIVNKNEDTEVDLGTVKIKEDVPFGKRKVLESSGVKFGDFEGGLSLWNVTTGTVFIESRCEEIDKLCKERIKNEYYARIYGNKSIIQSKPFMLQGKTLFFIGEATGSGTKTMQIRQLVSVDQKPLTTDPILIQQTFTDKGPWRAYAIDITKDDNGNPIPSGELVYLQLKTEGATNATFLVDEFRMESDDSSVSVVAVLAAKKPWEAIQGGISAIPQHITVEIDPKNEVTELNEITSQSIIIDDDPGLIIHKADYKLTLLNQPEPIEQIQGRKMTLTAQIENIGKTTNRETDLKWYTCQGDSNRCTTTAGYEDLWTLQQTDKVAGLNETGLSEGAIYTTPFELLLEKEDTTTIDTVSQSYTIWVKIVCNEETIVPEEADRKADNMLTTFISVYYPDLVVSDVWWIPEKPIDGEEVTFYAQIENRGKGGIIDDFEVQFTINKGLSTEEDLGTAKVQDDISIAGRKTVLGTDASVLIFENGGFESDLDPLAGWGYTGDITIESDFPYDTENNNNYAKLSGPGAILKSPSFNTGSFPYLVFISEMSGDGSKVLRVCKSGTDCQAGSSDELLVKTYTGDYEWREYQVNLDRFAQLEVYLKLEVASGANVFKVDDFHMANRGGFEDRPILSASFSNPLKEWVRISGNVYRESHFQSTTLPTDLDRVRNKYYAILNGADAELRSAPFELRGQSLMFRGYTSGSGTKQLRICRAGTTCQDNTSDVILTQTYEDKTPWHSYLIDISKYNGENAYLSLSTIGSGNMLFAVDDFQMKPVPFPYGSVVVVTSSNSKKWLARPNAKVTVTVDPKNDIFEVSPFYTFSDPVLRRKTNPINQWPGEDNNTMTRRIKTIDEVVTTQTMDITGDGILDIKDAIKGLKLLTNPNETIPSGLSWEDIHQDNQFEIFEMIYLLNLLSKE